MNAAHTPGPWYVVEPYLAEVQTADNLNIATCWHKYADGASIKVTGVLLCDLAESAANARLIASAPDLLEALLAAEDKAQRGILNMSDEDLERVVVLRRAAIAKATGQ